MTKTKRVTKRARPEAPDMNAPVPEILSDEDENTVPLVEDDDDDQPPEPTAPSLLDDPADFNNDEDDDDYDGGAGWDESDIDEDSL